MRVYPFAVAALALCADSCAWAGQRESLGAETRREGRFIEMSRPESDADDKAKAACKARGLIFDGKGCVKPK